MAIQKITSGIIQDGAVAAADIVSVANTAITGNIISSQITSVANTQITGLIQAAQIGSANATLVTSGTLPAAALPAGSVLQVVNATTSTMVSSSTNTFIDTGLTATITPRSTSSKILVSATINGTYKAGAATNVSTRLLRNSTAILSIDGLAGFTATATNNSPGSVSCNYLDSPATTSATTYKVQFCSDDNIAAVYVQNRNNIPNGSTSTIVLMEIQG
jgi:hypothetical protein